MQKLVAVATLLMAVFVSGIANAQNASPYVIGHWSLDDEFKDFKKGAAIETRNSIFVFQNPTPLTLTLEYAFFAPDGTFCGCDRDTLKPNGRTKYTMEGELEGGQFSAKLCPTQTDGTLKSIVFVPPSAGGTPAFGTDGSLQAGVQIDLGEDEETRTEADLNAIPVTGTITTEMSSIHNLCNGFIH